MKRRILSVMLILVMLSFGVHLFAAGQKDSLKDYPPEMVEWMKAAKLGPYDKGKQDWDEIKKLAFEEGEVVVYSSSSRIAKVAASFEKKYPGIKVTYFDLGSVGTVENLNPYQNKGLKKQPLWL